jgi:hypothetical protein
MAYQYNGKREAPVIAEAPHVPMGDEETRAKHAYFRDAEAGINGGPYVKPVKPARVTPIRPRAAHPACGTHSGYVKHIRSKTVPCQECVTARLTYQREYRERKRAA